LPPSVSSPSQLDVRGKDIRSVIWATGYHLDFAWVELPVFDATGTPIHRRGVTAMPGLYFLGLPWLHKRKSTFLAGVGEDAGFIADAIAGAREETED
jgi:putative flavoprotein involved in K+ transport